MGQPFHERLGSLARLREPGPGAALPRVLSTNYGRGVLVRRARSLAFSRSLRCGVKCVPLARARTQYLDAGGLASPAIESNFAVGVAGFTLLAVLISVYALAVELLERDAWLAARVPLLNSARSDTLAIATSAVYAACAVLFIATAERARRALVRRAPA